MLMFYRNTTKMPYVVSESSNTAELTITLYFTWNDGDVIFTFTALPRFDKPCETIQLFQYQGYFYVNFQSTAWTSETVIIVARYFIGMYQCCFMSVAIGVARRRGKVISEHSHSRTSVKTVFLKNLLFFFAIYGLFNPFLN